MENNVIRIHRISFNFGSGSAQLPAMDTLEGKRERWRIRKKRERRKEKVNPLLAISYDYTEWNQI